MLKKCIALLCLVQVGLAAFAQQITVSGRVTDSQGDPIPWAAVFQKGSQNGTSTDDDGYYTLDVKSSESIIVVSFIGYQDSEMTVGDRTTINFTLQSDAEMLDNAVVIGYGTARRQDLTGSVASINPEKLAQLMTPSKEAWPD